jgi:hypothetical protein
MRWEDQELNYASAVRLRAIHPQPKLRPRSARVADLWSLGKMNKRAFASLVTALAIASASWASEANWSSQSEIKRLALAIALTDFPVPQGKLRDIVGLPQHAPPLWGSSYDEGSSFWIAALTAPEAASGYYALRIVYRDYAVPPKPEEGDVLGLEVLFVAPNGMIFVGEHREIVRKMLPELKDQMKKKGLKPREWAAQFLSVTEDEPNQPPQRNAGSRPSSGDSPASETPSSLGPRG